MSSSGKLYLIPVPISDAPLFNFIPAYNGEVVRSLRNFIAEDAKTARKHLKQYGYPAIQDAQISLLNEHTNEKEFIELLGCLQRGEDAGLMSDAGCPGIADPGAQVVRLAHRQGIAVLPLAGPSSVMMAVMASGFNGQSFAFAGYLPVDKAARQKRIREMEMLAQKSRQAQFFIETPYRNAQVLESLLQTLAPSTLLFIGRDITAADQFLRTRTVAQWKAETVPALHKVPAVFGIFV